MGFGNRLNIYYVLNVQVMELFPDTFELFAPMMINPLRHLSEREAKEYAYNIAVFARSMN